jgi:hypothetical protein
MRLGLAALLLLTLAACGGGAGSDDASSPTPSPTTESAAAPSEVASSAEIASDVPSIANAIRSAVSDVGDVVEITEANDVNDLIGRPGQYDQAAFMASQVIGCDGDYDELSIDCGAKLERWASKADAQARSKDIQQKLKDYGLGAEWNYIQGRVLLRVAGDSLGSMSRRFSPRVRAPRHRVPQPTPRPISAPQSRRTPTHT